MHDKHQLLERAVVGLAVCAISVDILVSELPRLMPYLVALVVLFVILRVVVYVTRGDW